MGFWSRVTASGVTASRIAASVVGALVVSAQIVGCKKAVPAPADLMELAPYLYGNQDDPTLLGEGLASLAIWFDTRETAEDGYMLPALTEDAAVDISRPAGTSLSDTLGGYVDAQSTATLASHVNLILLADQTVVNPNDYSKNERTFVSGGDCFIDQGCDRLVTSNDIVKTAAFGVTIPYVYFKDYQWAHFTDSDGANRDAVVSRGWVEEEGWDEDHANGVKQSYTLDVFMDSPAGTVHRSQALWTELVLVIDGLVSQEFLEGQLISGLQAVMVDTDECIVEQGL
ncbi:MAG: hypothetical protein EXR69_05880 [Myxococcales bacterium]|nr:hypothetical protein [Myxococcales bacterium]